MDPPTFPPSLLTGRLLSSRFGPHVHWNWWSKTKVKFGSIDCHLRRYENGIVIARRLKIDRKKRARVVSPNTLIAMKNGRGPISKRRASAGRLASVSIVFATY